MNGTAPHPLRDRWRHRGLAVALTAVAVGTLPAAEPPTPPAARGDGFITAQTAGILTIEAGECFSNPFHSRAANEIVVIYTPCDQPVDNQSYGFLHAEEGSWDRAALAAFAWAGCRRGFDTYWPAAGSATSSATSSTTSPAVALPGSGDAAGIPAGQDPAALRRVGPAGNPLAFYPILPTAETWADGDRDVMCAVYNPQGRLPGSALPRAVG